MKPYKIDFQSVEDLECEIIKKGEVKIYLTKKETEEFVYENIYSDYVIELEFKDGSTIEIYGERKFGYDNMLEESSFWAILSFKYTTATPEELWFYIEI